MSAFSKSIQQLIFPNTKSMQACLDPDAEADAFFEAEKLRYEEQIEILEDAIENMKGVYQAWIAEHEKLAKELIETQAEARALKEAHQKEIEEIQQVHESEKYNQDDQVKELNSRHDEYRTHIEKELIIKDEIESRLRTQIEALTKELTIAKRIIGNPTLRDKGIKDLNFDKIFYYEYEMPVEKNKNKGQLRIKKPNQDLEEVQDNIRKTDRPQTTMREDSYQTKKEDTSDVIRSNLLKKIRKRNRSVASKQPQSTKNSSILQQ